MSDIDRFSAKGDRGGTVSGFVPTGADQVWTALARTSSAITDKIGRMADVQTVRENREAGIASMAEVKMPGVEFAFKEGEAASAGTGGTYVPPAGASDAHATAAGILRREEGFRPTPYWDVNAFRTGYGSDTITRADGSIVRVAQGMRVSREDGERDLFRRIGEFEGAAARSVGAVWQNLPAAARGALVSVAYNYGSLPRTVLAAAQSGDVNSIADAVGSLGANRDRRQREAQIIRSGAAAAPIAASATTQPGTEAVAGTPPSISVSLTPGSGAPKLKRPGTIAADAYNDAALDIYLGRLETSMSQQMDGLALQHQNDPAALTGALEALRGGYEKDLPPEQRALVAGAFERRKFALVRGAALDWQKKIQDEHQAVMEDTLATRQENALRIARRAGTDGQADKALAAEMEAIGRSIDGSTLDAAQKGRLKRKLESDVLTERITGGFENQPDDASRASFAQRFQTEWQSGSGFGGKVDVDTYDRVTGAMARRIEADRAASEKRGRVVEKEIGGQIDLLKKGYPVPDSRRQALRSAVAVTGDEQLGQDLDFLDGLSSWQAAHLGARPEVIAAQIDALKARMAKDGATPRALTTLNVMESLGTEMAKGLKEDPLTWADRAGVAKVEPLDFSTPEATIASMSERAADAETIAAHFGNDPRYFTPTEKEELTKALEKAPENLPAIAGAIRTAFGRQTPQALKEISKNAPVVAHAAGLYDATGDQRVITEVAEGLAWRRVDGYQKSLPSEGKIGAATSEAFAGALSRMPDTQGAAAATATVLAEARARRRGISLDEIDVPGSAANDLYAAALDDALGARTVDGVKMGGLTDVNGRRTVAPADMRADAVEDLVLEISDEDLASQAAIGSANGVPLTARLLRRGSLVAVGDGLYQMALGDPQSYDPRLVMGQDGRPWTLDIRRLAASQLARNVTGVFSLPGSR